MARFSSFIRTERGTEVHRLGHNELHSKTLASEASVQVYCIKTNDPEKKKVVHESLWINIGDGYQQHYKNDNSPYFNIVDGVIMIPADFMQRVEEYNRREVLRRKKREENS